MDLLVAGIVTIAMGTWLIMRANALRRIVAEHVRERQDDESTRKHHVRTVF